MRPPELRAANGVTPLLRTVALVHYADGLAAITKSCTGPHLAKNSRNPPFGMSVGPEP